MLSAIQHAYAWLVSHLPRDERGQDLIEYALLGGIIAVAIVAAGIFLTPAVESMATGIGRCIDFSNAAGSTCVPF